ncbi:peptidyl-glycine alpha-amidating monooxygenase-like [Mytilus galloprovincialis]|uniref:peptidyl-glycine alpha-amidating monooxygenase-like n=1 Tax=Mytilus galloprovincialis TaxID=29158 RepID=UPI003F7B3B0F
MADSFNTEILPLNACIIVLLWPLCCSGEIFEMFMEMPITNIEKNDTYICTAFKLNDVDSMFYQSLNFTVDEKRVHHLATGFCEQPARPDSSWDCTDKVGHHCTGATVNVAGWDDYTREEGQLHLPTGLTVKVGSKTKLKYFVTELHYTTAIQEDEQNRSPVTATLTLTDQPTKLRYQGYVMSTTGYIPSNTEKGFFASTACPWTGPAVFAFKYHVHTHHHGVLVEGFRVRNKTWTLLGSHLSLSKTKNHLNIQGGPIEIKLGDILAARCLFINPLNSNIKFGSTDFDEMCTFHLSLGYHPTDKAYFENPTSCSAESPQFSLCDYPDMLGKC